MSVFYKRQFFEKINTIDKPLARLPSLTKKKKNQLLKPGTKERISLLMLQKLKRMITIMNNYMPTI